MTRLGRKLCFPPLDQANSEGLLAFGGDLSVERLLLAYSEGIFPWYGPGCPILWWSPDPRFVLLPEEFHIPRSLHRVLKSGTLSASMNQAFAAVIQACAYTLRPTAQDEVSAQDEVMEQDEVSAQDEVIEQDAVMGQDEVMEQDEVSAQSEVMGQAEVSAQSEVIEQGNDDAQNGSSGTWLVPDMIQAYIALHAAGHAHSVEVWQQGRLVGGLYGVALGKVFFGESMFHLVPEASKVALVYLVAHLKAHGFTLLDCQQETAHMRRFGARALARARFMEYVKNGIQAPSPQETA